MSMIRATLNATYWQWLDFVVLLRTVRQWDAIWLILLAVPEMQYFDHNATTPLSEAAREAWLDAVERFPGNPSSPHRMGSRADRALTEAREAVASWLGISPVDLVWTSGATESSNMVFAHYAHLLAADDVVWVSAIEHPCVLRAARHFLGHRVREIPVDRDGSVLVAWLDEALQDQRPSLVVVMAANNETGVLQDWRHVQAWCQKNSVPYFCDAAQWIGKLPVESLGLCDWLIGCAHKFGGPKGVGFLKCPSKGVVHSLFVGGPQEMARRPGTENVAGVLSMVAAWAERERLLSPEWIHEQVTLRRSIEEALLVGVPGTQILGRPESRLWNTLAAVMPDCSCRFRWVVKLDREGFAVSTGSACASGKEEPSHVLGAMGFSAADAGRVIRCSSGPETTREDWEALLQAFARVGQEASRVGGATDS